jgi:putative hemolysin
MGRLPNCGETLTWRDLRIEVIDLDGQRIDKVLLSVRPPAPETPGQDE